MDADEVRLYCSICGEARGDDVFTCRAGGESVPESGVPGAGDRWVNAVLTVHIPLDGVTPDSPALEKQEAAARATEHIDHGDYAASVRWEDVVDGGSGAGDREEDT